MADESKQQTDDTQDDSKGEDTEATDTARGEKGGDDDKPGAALLKALKEEREARATAESALKKRERADREAETARAIKAGEWEAVAKAKDAEIGDLTTRIAELEGQIETSRLETVRERVASKHRLPTELAELLRGKDEAELTEHAKRLAKLVASPKAPDTQVGGGGTGGNGLPKTEEVKQGLARSGRFRI
jgi:hypothetical protein